VSEDDAAVKERFRALTTTSYAMLGLLSVRSWTGYELAKQMTRSLRYHWPRTESRSYLETKNLVAHGLASASTQATGRRPKTVYSITDEGRRALRRWLREDSTPPQFESEALTRAMFAESGTKEDLLATLRGLRDQAKEMRAQMIDQGSDYLRTGGPFPHRLHLIALNGRFILDYLALLEEWASWAASEVNGWPGVAPIADREAALRAFRSIIGEDLLRQIEEAALPG